MPISREPLNKRLLPAPPNPEPPIAKLKDKPDFVVGTGVFSGEHFYLCSNCGFAMFRRFKPDRQTVKTVWLCRCGQANVSKNI